MNYKKITFWLIAGLFLSAERNANAQIATFNATNSGDSGSIQAFTVPCGVDTITVEALGAQGGAVGGKGAQIQGTFTCVPGEVLHILVGQAGGSQDGLHGSGGGGSFVVKASDDSILVIAGGGGGHGYSGIDSTSDGWVSRNGQTAVGSGTASSGGGGGAAADGVSGGVGCNNGSPAASSVWAGGGGGYCGNGGIYNNNATAGGFSFLNGGWGGPAGPTGAMWVGGYGGGSGAGDRGAGGGGYSGGSGGTNNSVGGGGGGSYNSGFNQVGFKGVQSGDGKVVITWNLPKGPSVTANAVNNVSCHGDSNGMAAAIVSGGAKPFTYAWTPTGGTKDTARGLKIGTYTVTVTDSCGNTGSASVSITQPAAINLVKQSTPDNGSSNGTAKVTASGGVGPYTYLWSPGGSTIDSIMGKVHGTYCCKVTDKNGCMDSICVTIASSAGVTNVASNSAKVAIYPNPNNGAFTLQLSDGYQLSANNQVEIYNMLGEKVYSSIINATNTQINLAGKSTGIYMYRLLSPSGNLVDQGKFVIEQ
ncbi:MAG: T9SS type A sorting domain-containing protein [Bacteroidia bacterium]|nr:T9SS type A sorting domain-containing protein [Bacteroidia bacterium]